MPKVREIIRMSLNPIKNINAPYEDLFTRKVVKKTKENVVNEK